MAYIQLDTDAMKNYMKSHGITAHTMSAMVGRSKTFIYSCIQNGHMLDASYKMLMERLDLPYDAFTVRNPAAAKSKCGPSPSQGPYSLYLQVHPDKLLLSLRFNEQEMYSAYARIKGGTERDLLQGISYAAHLIYKMSEQEYLRGEE